MITMLRAQNFKSWLDTGDLRMAPLTGFFGTNSSGKTSLLQLLLMMKQTVEPLDRKLVLNLGNKQTYVNLGTFRDIVHGRQLPADISFSITWQVPDDMQQPHEIDIDGYTIFSWDDTILFFLRDKIVFINNLGGSGATVDEAIRDTVVSSISLNVVVEGDAEGTAVREFSYNVCANGNLYRFGMRRKGDASSAYEFMDAAVSQKLLKPLPPPIKSYAFPDILVTGDSYLRELPEELEEVLSEVYYLGPLRDYPQRDYRWEGSKPTGVGNQGENAVAAMLDAPETQPKVANWLQKLGLIESFDLHRIAETSPIYEVRVRTAGSPNEVLLTDVGFGVSQLLPVLVLLYYVPEGSIVILEQPEIPLHPSVQAGLADVLIDAIKTRGIQIILESHSEHLLLRLQRRIAEGAFDNDDAALYFCESKNGASKATPLQINDYGDISNWPRNFFGDQLGEAAATTRAAIERMRQQGATNGSGG